MKRINLIKTEFQTTDIKYFDIERKVLAVDKQKIFAKVFSTNMLKIS